ncbi:hypothetical protein CAEBREN_22776 [Caenorhabditis brenneri]|uniref:JmjC domain-containing protein n=1 Tax=Caenorhabditis brenneri TaxID=135651 RepID=G0MAL7_CAEBE|nr:hypothetical protein CAEBREN_22776 [Caenorhabditis brenneri]
MKKPDGSPGDTPVTPPVPGIESPKRASGAGNGDVSHPIQLRCPSDSVVAAQKGSLSAEHDVHENNSNLSKEKDDIIASQGPISETNFQNLYRTLSQKALSKQQKNGGGIAAPSRQDQQSDDGSPSLGPLLGKNVGSKLLAPNTQGTSTEQFKASQLTNGNAINQQKSFSTPVLKRGRVPCDDDDELETAEVLKPSKRRKTFEERIEEILRKKEDELQRQWAKKYTEQDEKINKILENLPSTAQKAVTEKLVELSSRRMFDASTQQNDEVVEKELVAVTEKVRVFQKDVHDQTAHIASATKWLEQNFEANERSVNKLSAALKVLEEVGTHKEMLQVQNAQISELAKLFENFSKANTASVNNLTSSIQKIASKIYINVDGNDVEMSEETGDDDNTGADNSLVQSETSELAARKIDENNQALFDNEEQEGNVHASQNVIGMDQLRQNTPPVEEGNYDEDVRIDDGITHQPTSDDNGDQNNPAPLDIEEQEENVHAAEEKTAQNKLPQRIPPVEEKDDDEDEGMDNGITQHPTSEDSDDQNNIEKTEAGPPSNGHTSIADTSLEQPDIPKLASTEARAPKQINKAAQDNEIILDRERKEPATQPLLQDNSVVEEERDQHIDSFAGIRNGGGTVYDFEYQSSPLSQSTDEQGEGRPENNSGTVEDATISDGQGTSDSKGSEEKMTQLHKAIMIRSSRRSENSRKCKTNGQPSEGEMVKSTAEVPPADQTESKKEEVTITEPDINWFTLSCFASKLCKVPTILTPEQEEEKEKLLLSLKETALSDEIPYKPDILYKRTERIVKNACSEATLKGERNMNEQEEDARDSDEEGELEGEPDSESEQGEDPDGVRNKKEEMMKSLQNKIEKLKQRRKKGRKTIVRQNAPRRTLPFLLFTSGFKDDVIGASGREIVGKASSYKIDGKNAVYNSELFRYAPTDKHNPPTFFQSKGFEVKRGGRLPIVTLDITDKDLEAKATSLSVCLIQNCEVDVNAFKYNKLIDLCGQDAKITTVRQRPQHSNQNQKFRGTKKDFHAESFPEKMLLREVLENQKKIIETARKGYVECMSTSPILKENLLKMEKALKDAQLPWDDMPFPVITFGVNIDIGEAEEQLAAIKAALPEWTWPNERLMALLKSVKMPGINEVQVYAKVAGCRTIAHFESEGIGSINVNLGPDDCVWYTVPMEFAASLEKLLGEDRANLCSSAIWLNEGQLEKAGISYSKFVQKAGEMVFVNTGTYHWVQSNGFCMNISWNTLMENHTQLAAAALFSDLNLTHKYATNLPIERLIWTIAEQKLQLGTEFSRLTKRLLISSLAHAKMELDYVEKEGYEIKSGEDPEYDEQIFTEATVCHNEKCYTKSLYNLIFLKKIRETDAIKSVPICLDCVISNGNKKVTCYRRKTIDQLVKIFDAYH